MQPLAEHLDEVDVGPAGAASGGLREHRALDVDVLTRLLDRSVQGPQGVALAVRRRRDLSLQLTPQPVLVVDCDSRGGHAEGRRQRVHRALDRIGGLRHRHQGELWAVAERRDRLEHRRRHRPGCVDRRLVPVVAGSLNEPPEAVRRPGQNWLGSLDGVDGQVPGELAADADPGCVHVGAGRVARVAELGRGGSGLPGPPGSGQHGVPGHRRRRRGTDAEGEHGFEPPLSRQVRSDAR